MRGFHEGETSWRVMLLKWAKSSIIEQSGIEIITALHLGQKLKQSRQMRESPAAASTSLSNIHIHTHTHAGRWC